MKTLILLAFVIVTNMFAGKIQDIMCGDKSLLHCISHYDRQCVASNYFACYIVGDLYSEQRQYGEAGAYIKIACDKAKNKDIFAVELIDGMVVEFPILLFTQPSCSNFGALYYQGYGARQSYEKVLQYRKKVCDLGDGKSCAGVGKTYYKGWGIKQNLPKAKEFYGKACDLGKQDSCDEYKRLNEY